MKNQTKAAPTCCSPRRRSISQISSPSSVVLCALVLLLAASPPAAYAFSPSPSMHPEDVVRKQLDAFSKSDIGAAFQYASPENQLVTGPLELFEEMLLETQVFRPIVGHQKAEVLMTVAHDDWGMGCLVRLVPSIRHSKPCLEYWWELTKQPETAGATAGCWMIDSVLPDFEDMSIQEEEIYLEDLEDLFD